MHLEIQTTLISITGTLSDGMREGISKVENCQKGSLVSDASLRCGVLADAMLAGVLIAFAPQLLTTFLGEWNWLKKNGL